MDEKVINDLYSHAASKGYKKDINEFKTLLQTNDKVLNDMYAYVQGKGYKKDINSFSQLVGKQATPSPSVEKKNRVQSANALPIGGENVTVSSTETVTPSTVSASESVQKPAPTPLASTRMPQAPTSDPNLIARQQQQQAVEQQRNAQQIAQQQAFNQVPTTATTTPAPQIDASVLKPMPTETFVSGGEAMPFQRNVADPTPKKDQNYLSLGQEEKPLADNLLKGVYADVISKRPDKANVSEEEITEYIYANTPDTGNPEVDIKVRNAALEQVLGNKNIGDNRFDEMRSKYKKEERSNVLNTYVKKEYGDFADALVEELGIKRGISDSQENLNNSTVTLSDNALKALYEHGEYGFHFDHGDEGIPLQLRNSVTKNSRFGVTFYSENHPKSNHGTIVELPFEEVKRLYQNGVLSFSNPLYDPMFSAYVFTSAPNVEKAKTDELKNKAIESFIGKPISKATPQEKVAGFLKVVKDVDANIEKLGIIDTDAKIIKKSYDRLIDVNNKVKEIDAQISALQEGRMTNEKRQQLSVLNTQREIYQERVDEMSTEIEQRKENVLGYSTKLFDPLTGKPIDPSLEKNNPSIAKWNEDLNNKTDKYLKGYKGSLEEAKVDVYNKFKYYQDLILSQDRFKEYFDDVKNGGVPYPFFESSDRLLNAYQDAASDLTAVSRVEALNLDVQDMPRYKGAAFVNGLLDASIGGKAYKTSTEFVQDFVKVAEENGINLSEAQKERAKETFGEKAAYTAGAMIPVMAEIIGSTLLTQGTGTATVIAETANLLKGLKAVKDSQAWIKTISILEKAVQSGVVFDVAGQGFLVGVGESFGEGIGTALTNSIDLSKMFGSTKMGKVFGTMLNAFAKRAAGATGETLAEYTGEFFDELSRNDLTTAIANTVGEDYAEKLALMFMMTGGMSAAASVGQIGTLRNNIKQAIKSDPRPDSELPPIVKEVKAAILEQEKAEAEIEKKVSKAAPIGGETTVETTTETETEPTKPSINPIVENIEGATTAYTDSEGLFVMEDALIKMIENGDEEVNGILLTNPSQKVVAALEKAKEVAPEMGTSETVKEESPIVAETSETLESAPIKEEVIADKEEKKKTFLEKVKGLFSKKEVETEAEKSYIETELERYKERIKNVKEGDFLDEEFFESQIKELEENPRAYLEREKQLFESQLKQSEENQNAQDVEYYKGQIQKIEEALDSIPTSETVTEMGTEETPIVAETVGAEPLKDVESTVKALRDKRDLTGDLIPLGLIPDNVFDEINQGQGSEQIISEAYHKAKKDGSNPELVSAVESLLGTPTTETTPQATQAGETNTNQNEVQQTETQAEATPETVQVEAGKAIETPPLTVTPQVTTQAVPTPQGFDTKLKELGYSDTDISGLTFEQKQDIVKNQTQKPEVADSAKLPETKPTLTEGAVIDLPPLIAGGQPRVMTYKDGKWVQKIGGIESNVSEKVQQEAQQKWNEENGLSTPIDSKAKDVTPETKTDEAKTPELPKEIEKPKANLLADKLRERAAKLRGASGGTLTALPNAVATSMEALATILDKVGDIQAGIAKWRKSEAYKNLSKEEKAEVDAVANELVSEVEVDETIEPTEKAEPKPKTEKPASDGGEKSKISRQTRRAAELSNDELAAELKEIGKYRPTSFEEVSKNVDNVIELLGAEEAIILASVPGNMSEDLAIAVLTEASAKVAREARIEAEKARKLGDVEAEQRALKKERDALVAANKASKEKTKMGAIIAYTKKSYEKYPDIYANKLVQDFADTNSAPLSEDYGTEGKTLGEEIETVRDGVAKGVSDVVDSVLDNESMLQRIAELEAELEKAKSESGKAKTDKKNRDLKKKGNDLMQEGLALLLKKPSASASGSFIGLSNEQLTGIKKILQGLTIQGYANTSIIINKAYSFIKENLPDLNVKKGHLREIAKEIAEFNTMLTNEVYGKESARVEALKKELKDLQEGKESVDLRVKPEDSAEVKALKEEIAKEREITPKKLKEMVKDHYLGKNPGSRTLAEAIANKTGKSPSEVQSLADAIEANINEKLNRMVEAEVKKFIDKAADTPKNKTLKELRDKQRTKEGLTPDEIVELDRRLENSRNQKEINKIIDILKKGNLKSSNEFAKAFESRFKFKTLSDEAKGTILQIQNRLAELAQRANDIEKKILVGGKEEVVKIQRKQRAEVSRLTKELSTVLESQRPSTYASFLMATLGTSYTFMLSSLTTLYNALKGGMVSGAIDTAIYSLANARSAFKVIGNPSGGMGAALRRAGNAAATGMDLFGENVMKGEYNSSYFSPAERKLLKGLNQAIRDKDTKTVVGKIMGSIVKNIHLLGGIDALQVSLGANFITSVENVKAARRGAETVVKEKYRQEALSEGKTADEAELFASQKMKESGVKSEVRQKESEMVKDYFERARALRNEYTGIAKEEYQSDLDNVTEEVEELIKLGKIKESDKANQIRIRMSEIVGLTTSKIDPEAHYVSTRVRELIENQNEKIFQAAVSVVKEATMQSLPDGILGKAVSAIQSKTTMNRDDRTVPAIAKWGFNSLFRFQRLMALDVQKRAYSIPLLGIALATIGVGKDVSTGEFTYPSAPSVKLRDFSKSLGLKGNLKVLKEGLSPMFSKYEANPLLAKQRIYKNVVITAASMIALALMYDFDDDDDETGLLSDFLGGPSRWKLDPNRPIDVRGFGFGGALDKKTSSNYLPLSFSTTKDEKGNFINYNETKQIPELATIISFLGTFSDDSKQETSGFQKRIDNSFLRYYLNSALNTAASTLESSFSSVGRMTKDYDRGVQTGGDRAAGWSEVASSIVAGEVGTLLNPTILRHLTEVAKAAGDLPKTDTYATFLSKAFNNAFYLDWALPNATDQFGNEIPQDVSLKKVIPWEYKEEMKDNPKFKTTVGLMYKFGKGLDIPYQSMPEMKKNAEFKTSFTSNTGTKYTYTFQVKDSEIQKEAQEKYKEELKSLMDKSFDKLDKIDNYEDLNEAVGKIRTKAKDNTEMYIVKKYKNDETKIIKK